MYSVKLIQIHLNKKFNQQRKNKIIELKKQSLKKKH